jgi:hypothetical protein
MCVSLAATTGAGTRSSVRRSPRRLFSMTAVSFLPPASCSSLPFSHLRSSGICTSVRRARNGNSYHILVTFLFSDRFRVCFLSPTCGSLSSSRSLSQDSTGRFNSVAWPCRSWLNSAAEPQPKVLSGLRALKPQHRERRASSVPSVFRLCRSTERTELIELLSAALQASVNDLNEKAA